MLKRDEQVGDYILIERLGSGGFGDVWKAEKRTVLSTSNFAIKFFSPKDDEDLDIKVIRKEVETWQSLSGLPHVISVIEANIFDNYVYIVSEFADGGSLDKWLRAQGGKADSYTEAVSIIEQVLQGLEGMHKEGFVHRDLKPANVLIKKNVIYLADFGISREMKTHSKTTGTAGTYEYMPPEAFEAQPLVSVHTDIWASGVLLQKLLTGNLPFPQKEIPSLMGAILMRDPEPLPLDVPYKLKEVVRKSLQKKREDRYQTVREMREALRESLQQTPVTLASDSDSIQTIDAAKIKQQADDTIPFHQADSIKSGPSAKIKKQEVPTEHIDRGVKVDKDDQPYESYLNYLKVKNPEKLEPPEYRSLNTPMNKTPVVIAGLAVSGIFIIIAALCNSSPSFNTAANNSNVYRSATNGANTAANTVANKPSPPVNYDIPPIKGTVEPLKFYAYDETNTDIEHRKYSTAFFDSDIQYINYELKVSYPTGSDEKDFTVDVIWSGSPNCSGKKTYKISGGPNTIANFFSDGCGYSTKGSWKTGNYTVSISYKGKIISQGNFYIVSGSEKILK